MTVVLLFHARERRSKSAFAVVLFMPSMRCASSSLVQVKQRDEGGVARDTISQWARNYEADGMAAFMTCKNRVYSPEFKRQAVEDYLSGMGSQ